MTDSDRRAISVTIVVIIGVLFASLIVFLTAVSPGFRIMVVAITIPILLSLGIHLAGWDGEDY